MYGKSPTRYVTVETAAEVLRVNKESIYRNLHEIPHERNGRYVIIPCEFLLLEPPATPVGRRHRPTERWYKQLELPFDVVPDRRWRNTGRRVYRNPFGYHS